MIDMNVNKCLRMLCNYSGEKVSIENNDIPAGWEIVVYGRKIDKGKFAYNYSKTDWLYCISERNIFKALTGPRKFHDGILYLSSLQNIDNSAKKQQLKECIVELLTRMDFEEDEVGHRCQIESLNESEWGIEVNLEGTALESLQSEDMKYIDIHVDAWKERRYRWNFTKNRYYAACNADNIDIILNNFESLISRVAWSEEEVIAGLEKWFSEHCDEDWEHDQVVDIKLKDGIWTVRLDAFDNGEKRKGVKKRRTDGKWMECGVEEGIFIGRGDTLRIFNIIKCFIDWCVDGQV
jgi:hypothetical protein